jgi:hypothetical protein
LAVRLSLFAVWAISGAALFISGIYFPSSRRLDPNSGSINERLEWTTTADPWLGDNVYLPLGRSLHTKKGAS